MHSTKLKPASQRRVRETSFQEALRGLRASEAAFGPVSRQVSRGVACRKLRTRSQLWWWGLPALGLGRVGPASGPLDRCQGGGVGAGLSAPEGVSLRACLKRLAQAVSRCYTRLSWPLFIFKKLLQKCIQCTKFSVRHLKRQSASSG